MALVGPIFSTLSCHYRNYNRFITQPYVYIPRYASYSQVIARRGGGGLPPDSALRYSGGGGGVSSILRLRYSGGGGGGVGFLLTLVTS